MKENKQWSVAYPPQTISLLCTEYSISHGVSARTKPRISSSLAAVVPANRSKIVFFRSRNRAPSLLRRGKVHLVEANTVKARTPSNPLVPLDRSWPGERTRTAHSRPGGPGLSLSLSGESPAAPSRRSLSPVSPFLLSSSPCFVKPPPPRVFGSVKDSAYHALALTRTTVHACTLLRALRLPSFSSPARLISRCPLLLPLGPAPASATVVHFFCGVLSRSNKGLMHS